MLPLPADFIARYSDTGSNGLSAWWFAFIGNRLLVQSGERVQLPCAPVWPLPAFGIQRQLCLGQLGGLPCYALELSPAELPAGLHLLGLRDLWGRCDEPLLALAGLALQVLDWDRCHQFCGRCGTPMQTRQDERAKHCPACELVNYPRIAPVAMVRVTHEDRILLARSPHFAPGRYSVLAGFAEAGETLEQTAAREVREEVGIEIRNLRYFTSQSWPFPHSLMIGFTAEYADGEITVDGVEIETAGWYRRDQMPGLPMPYSIAYWLIDDWLKGQP